MKGSKFERHSQILCGLDKKLSQVLPRPSLPHQLGCWAPNLQIPYLPGPCFQNLAEQTPPSREVLANRSHLLPLLLSPIYPACAQPLEPVKHRSFRGCWSFCAPEELLWAQRERFGKCSSLD